MDAYESKLRSGIEACDREEAALAERLAELRVRKQAFNEALDLYLENRPRRKAPPTRQRGRGDTKIDFVMKAIADSGKDGILTRQIYKMGKQAGVELKPNSVRSQLYARKVDGKVEQLADGRYRLIKYKDEAPDPSGSSATSSHGDGNGNPSSTGNGKLATSDAFPGAIPAHPGE